MTGWPKAEAMGEHYRPILRFVDHDTGRPQPHPIEQVLNSGQAVRLAPNSDLLTRSQQRLGVEDSASPVHDAEKNLNGVVLVLRDCSEQRLAEAEKKSLQDKMQTAQRLESLGLLSGGIAHDFNNLLSIISLNSGLLDHGARLDHEERECLAGINQAVERAADLCKQMLAFAGKGTLTLSPFDLSLLVQNTVTLLRAGLSKKCQIEMALAGSLPTTFGDKSQIQQVVMNLILNASEAIGEDPGVISVVTRCLQADDPSLQALEDFPADRPHILLEVRDTGCGMDAQTRSRIFDPFYSTKLTGRGLGLAAVTGIVRQHRGAILVDSQPGEGTAFRVLLPVLPEPTKASSQP